MLLSRQGEPPSMVPGGRREVGTGWRRQMQGAVSEGIAEVVGRAGSCGENDSQLYGATVTSGAGDAVCASAMPKTDERRFERKQAILNLDK